MLDDLTVEVEVILAKLEKTEVQRLITGMGWDGDKVVGTGGDGDKKLIPMQLSSWYSICQTETV